MVKLASLAYGKQHSKSQTVAAAGISLANDKDIHWHVTAMSIYKH
jgi:hypothetical protein